MPFGEERLREIEDEERARKAIRDKLAAEDSATSTGQEDIGKRQESRDRSRWGWFLWAAIALFVVAICGAVVENATERRPSQAEMELDARYYARQAVTESLKAPSTAEFPSVMMFSVEQIDNQEWAVRGYVDSQNAPGALIRSRWLVVVRKRDEKWSIVSVEIGKSSSIQEKQGVAEVSWLS